MQDIHLKWYIPVLCNIHIEVTTSFLNIKQRFLIAFRSCMGLSMSHKATISLISEVGKNHDQKVKEW